MPRKKKQSKPTKQCVKPILDTPKNVARALFGIKSTRRSKHPTKA
jgi:hypothetical protein